MLNRSACLAMSTSFLEALPGKLDIKRHSPSILYISTKISCADYIIKNHKHDITQNWNMIIKGHNSLVNEAKLINRNSNQDLAMRL